MAVVLQFLVVVLLAHRCSSSPEDIKVGCKKWHVSGDTNCCDECYPGNRVVTRCGPDPKTMCVPCEPGKYTLDPSKLRCERCSQCVGAQVLWKSCTYTSNTVCRCREGLTCGDPQCSFCVKECGKGFEPLDDGSCRPCPTGTYNDKIHQKCKPCSPRCPKPNSVPVTEAIVFSTTKRNDPQNESSDSNEQSQLFILVLVMVAVLIVFCIVFIIAVSLKIQKRRTINKKPIPKSLITTPSDEPRTLIAIECSYHEAEQEQGGSSTESLISQ